MDMAGFRRSCRVVYYFSIFSITMNPIKKPEITDRNGIGGAYRLIQQDIIDFTHNYNDGKLMSEIEVERAKETITKLGKSIEDLEKILEAFDKLNKAKIQLPEVEPFLFAKATEKELKLYPPPEAGTMEDKIEFETLQDKLNQ